MTENMHAAVTALYPAFDKEIYKRPLMTATEQAEVLRWKKEKVDGLLKDPDGWFKDSVARDGLDPWRNVRPHFVSFIVSFHSFSLSES